MTTPNELRRMNIEHFEHLLARTADPEERARIKRLMEEERTKTDSAYPQTPREWTPNS